MGIYGFSYLEAGRNVVQLFENKGWTVIITDDLCDRALFMVSLGVGFVTGLVAWAISAADQTLLGVFGDETGIGGFL